MLVAGDRRRSCSPPLRSTSPSCSTRSPRARATASTTGTGSSRSTDFVGLDNFRRAFSDDLFRDALTPQRHHHRAVAAAADPVRARPGGAAQRASSRAGACCARCSSPRTSCPRSSPASCGARSCARTACSTRSSTAIGAGGLHPASGSPTPTSSSTACSSSSRGSTSGSTWCCSSPGSSRSPTSSARRPSIDGAIVVADASATSPCRCSARRSGCRSSCRSSARCSCSTCLGHHQGRPDRRLVDDGDIPRRPVPRGQFGYASAVSIVIFGFSLVVALLYQRFALRRDLRGTGLVG